MITGDEDKQEMDITEKEQLTVDQATCFYLCKKVVYKEQLQGEGSLPHNREIPRGSAQHVQHKLFSNS